MKYNTVPRREDRALKITSQNTKGIRNHTYEYLGKISQITRAILKLK